jgi:hypothetical protein
MRLFNSICNENFKKIIIIFWTLWWLIALWTDIVGGLAHFGLLAENWAPDSNYPFLVSSLKMYNPPVWLPLIFFLGILLWSFISTLAFVYASLKMFSQGLKPAMKYIEIAFIISLSYWFAFYIADQLVMKFDLEENHIVQGGFQLLTFIALYCLPSKPEGRT